MNQPDAKLSALPSGLQCPQCHADLPQAMSMVGHQQVQMRKGMIMVCSACATPLILGDTTFRPLSRAEFDRYPPQTKGTILATVNAIRQKVKKNGEWTPYRDTPGAGGPA